MVSAYGLRSFAPWLLTALAAYLSRGTRQRMEGIYLHTYRSSDIHIYIYLDLKIHMHRHILLQKHLRLQLQPHLRTVYIYKCVYVKYVYPCVELDKYIHVYINTWYTFCIHASHTQVCIPVSLSDLSCPPFQHPTWLPGLQA